MNVDTKVLKLRCEPSRPQSQRQAVSEGVVMPSPEKLSPALRLSAGPAVHEDPGYLISNCFCTVRMTEEAEG